MTEPALRALADPGARERLLRAASVLFARKGYAATTVREIVEAAGVTKPVLYYYFRSKEGLFQDLSGLAIAAHDALLEEIRQAPGTPTEKIRLLFDRVFALIEANVDVVRMLDAVYYGPPESSPPFDFDKLYGAFHRHLRRFVEEGVACGELRAGDAEIMTLALLGGWVIAVDTTTCCHEHGLGAGGVARVRELILDGLRAGGRGQGAE
ncbi:MAG: TetR/AcrR family transcriptional regulator [Candidatus Krumholzibacteriia bacterium]